MKRAHVFVPVLIFVFLTACGGSKQDKLAVADPEFCKDIAPVIFKNCVPCHRKEGTGPFPLTTYTEISRKAKTINAVTRMHMMPPWPADTAYSHFVGERMLSAGDRELIRTWVEKGCKEGKAKDLPALPEFPGGSLYGKPDLVVRMKQPLLIKGDNTDRFLLMKFPYEIPHDTFIRFIEFVPGKKKLVHHVNGFLIQYFEPEKKKNVFEGEWVVNTQSMDYKEAYERMKLPNDDGSYPMLTPSAVNYLPGVEPPVYPPGVGGFRMKKKGTIFLKDIHYGPSARDEYDSSYFNVFYAAVPPKRQLLEFQMGTLGKTPVVPPLQVPADSIKTFTTEYRLPEAWSVITINPHMHLLGKTFLAYALTPAGDTIHLIHIPQWDFHWQYFYTFRKMVKIPAGSLLRAVAVYDNTRNNPLNPFQPPRIVGERNGSMRTTDEMFQFIINYLPYREGDENLSLEPK
ncbi:MAG: cytochrome c [Bacteroidia bacterium]